LAEAAIQGNKNEDSNGDASATSEANEDSADASPHDGEKNEGEAPLTMEQNDEAQGDNEEHTSTATMAVTILDGHEEVMSEGQ